MRCVLIFVSIVGVACLYFNSLYSLANISNSDFVDKNECQQGFVSQHGFLHASGGMITDQLGQQIVLRGVSLYWGQVADRFYSEDTISWLRDDWHINAIRLAVGVELGGYLTNPQKAINYADVAIRAAIENDLYVIVDWHAHDLHPAEAVYFMERIAKKYGSNKNIIYEIYNEPKPGLDWKTDIKPYHEVVIRAIRSHDRRNLIVVGTPNWSQYVDVASLQPVDDANVAYSLHFYAGSHGAELRHRADNALKNGVTLLVTEWGTSEATGNGKLDLKAAAEWLAWLEARKIGYLNWSIVDRQESSAALMNGAATSRWPLAVLTSSGRFVRNWLREMNSGGDRCG